MDDNSVLKVQPNDRTAEMAVIGSMLMEREVIADISDILVKEDFYVTAYGIIFEAMVELFNEGISVDPITVADRLRRNNAPEEVANIAYLAEAVDAVPTAVNGVDYAKVVKEKATLRAMIQLTQKISDQCYSGIGGAERILEDAEKDIFELVQKHSTTQDFVPMQEIVIDVINQVDEASKKDGKINGLPTGFTDLDNLLTGFHENELILVAARPAMGKTAFVLNIAHHVAVHQNKPVIMFSLEMSKDQLVTRLMAVDSMVDAQMLKTGNLRDEEWDKLIESAEIMSKAPIFIDDNSGITINELRAECRKLAQRMDIGLIVIDYLQLMNTTRKVESRQQFISEVSRSLKNLARELKVPVVALSQLNRAVDSRPDHKPVLADLRESGAIEQDADVVMFIYRDDYYNKESEKPGIAEIIVAKQRSGSTGSIDLVWIGKYTKFSNVVKIERDKK